MKTIELIQKACHAIIDRGTRNWTRMENGCMTGKYDLTLTNKGIVWVSPEDIEDLWVEGSDRSPWYLIRTKSGKEFTLTEKSWYKALHGTKWYQEQVDKKMHEGIKVEVK